VADRPDARFHAARVFAPGAWPDDVLLRFALVPARYAEAVSSGGLSLKDLFDLVAPFIGYLFLHGDFTHVGINSFGSWHSDYCCAPSWDVEVPAVLFFCGIIAALTI